MQNPANFGMAKSFFRLGSARGFDMTDPAELQSFTAAYNAELPHRSEPGDLEAPDHGLLDPYSPLPPLQSTSDKKAKCKMSQESRKRNRRKK